jgi:hypothetical protein
LSWFIVTQFLNKKDGRGFFVREVQFYWWLPNQKMETEPSLVALIVSGKQQELADAIEKVRVQFHFHLSSNLNIYFIYSRIQLQMLKNLQRNTLKIKRCSTQFQTDFKKAMQQDW